MAEAKTHEFTKYETARILGARALQIAMNAPLLVKINSEDLEKIKYDAIKIAEIELKSGVLPITVRKPFPQKKEEKLKRAPEKKLSDKDVETKEGEEEEELAKDGEIMEIANPEDETESEDEIDREEERD